MDILLPKFIKYQLYLLQLENYELGRYWKLLLAKGFFPKKSSAQRKELVWTAKAKALMLMAAALHVLLAAAVSFAAVKITGSPENVVSFSFLALLVFLPFYFMLFTAALILIRPLDAYVKNRTVRQAKEKISGLKRLKVIGIAGSYGKTTMKEVLRQALGAKLSVAATPESYNLPISVSQFILKKVDESTDVLILEFGEHYRGDVKALCEIARPDISVVTGINEAHFERMGSLQNITATIFEAVECAKTGALIVLNGDDKNVAQNFQKFTAPGQKVKMFAAADLKSEKFDADALVWEAKSDEGGDMQIPLLGRYALADVSAAISIARELGVGSEDIKIGLAGLRPVEHRLQPIRSAGNMLVIDDSYNGNPAGAAEAIKVLSRFTDRRKVYITPGLVESGSKAKEIHEEIGRQLAGVADVVILIKNSVTPYIESGMSSVVASAAEAILNNEKIAASPDKAPTPRDVARERYVPRNDTPAIIWFNTAQEAHENLKNILQPGDVVLFQNDWGDQYV